MNVQEILTKWGFHIDHKPLEKLEHRIEQIKERLEFLAAAEVVKGIFELAEKFSHFAENLGTAATSAGLTVEELQRLQYAAGQAGVGAEEVSGSMARLTRTLYEARNGSASAKEAFAKAGITDEQIAGFHTGADAMGALADRMKGMTDPIAKQALAMQLLGRGSHNMVEFLSDGSEAIKKLGDQADRVGAVVSTKDIKALREMEDAMSSLGQMVRAISAHFAAQFAPAIREVVHDLQNFYAANKDIIQSRLHDWAMGTVYALGYVVGVVETLTKVFFEFARGHEELFKTLGKAALGYTAVNGIMGFAKTLSPAVSLLAGSFKSVIWATTKFAGALEWIAMKGAILLETTLPFLSEALLTFAAFLEASPLAAVSLLVAAVASLVLIGEAAYTMLYKGGSFKDTWLGKLWEGTKGTANWIAKKLGLHWFDEDPLKDKKPGYEKGAAIGPMFNNEKRDPKTGEYPANAGARTQEQLAELAKTVPWYAAQLRDAAALAAQSAPPMAPGYGAANDPSGRYTPTAQQTFNVNLTVAAPNGQDPKEYGRKVGAGFAEGVQSQTDLRSSHAAVSTPEKY